MAKEYTEHYNLEQDDENEFYDVAVQNRNMDSLDSIIYALGQAVAEKLQSSAYTAEDVLAKLKTVDGVGSGLDADRLQGKSADEFINPFIEHLKDYVAQPAATGTVSGSSINYTYTTNPAPTELKDRIGLVFQPHADSFPGSSPTLNWNGLGAKPIQNIDGSPAVLKLSGVYTLRYQAFYDAFILQGSTSPAIEESGNNLNGYYLRFSDGTQICWAPKSEGIACDIPDEYDGSFKSPEIVWTYPASFNGAGFPTLIGGISVGGISVGVRERTDNYCHFVVKTIVSSPVKNRFPRLMAIGKWK